MESPNDKMPGSEMMIYTTEDGLTKIETTFDGPEAYIRHILPMVDSFL